MLSGLGDSLHGYWQELLSYNPQGVQSSELGVLHALAAAALFSAEVDEDEDAARDADEEREDRPCGRYDNESK
jgi:hypothetical protein